MIGRPYAFSLSETAFRTLYTHHYGQTAPKASGLSRQGGEGFPYNTSYSGRKVIG